jgi:hypothetical protein
MKTKSPKKGRRALTLDSNGGNSDYTLVDGFPSVWITVDGISVYVLRGKHGVSVSLFKKGDEDGNTLAGTGEVYR